MKLIIIVTSILAVLTTTTPLKANSTDLAAITARSEGYAITADSIGLESLYKNPAGLASIQTTTVITSYSSLFDQQVQAASFGVGLPLSETIKIGLLIPIYRITSIPKSIDTGDTLGTQTGTFDDVDTTTTLGISQSLFENRLHLGIAYAYHAHTIDKTQGTGFGLDAGLLLETDLATLGISLQNIGGTKIKWDTGTTEKLSETLNIGICTELPLIDKVLADTTIEKDKDPVYNVGIEKKFSEYFSIRAGLEHLNKNPQLSIGTTIAVEKTEISYTYSNNIELGITHQIGLQFEF